MTSPAQLSLRAQESLLWTRVLEKLTPLHCLLDRQGALERAPGMGGPSGCKEAWITALGTAERHHMQLVLFVLVWCSWHHSHGAYQVSLTNKNMYLRICPSFAGNDGFLPAVLVLLHTIRKYAMEDRDFIALVSSAVSEVIS